MGAANSTAGDVPWWDVATCGVGSGVLSAVKALTAPKQSAFVFAKPHANTKQVQALIRKTFAEVGVSILREGEITGEVIDAKGYIDQHCKSAALEHVEKREVARQRRGACGTIARVDRLRHRLEGDDYEAQGSQPADG